MVEVLVGVVDRAALALQVPPGLGQRVLGVVGVQAFGLAGQLVDAGVNAGVLMNPIVPGFSSSREKLERTVKAIADHGARFVGCNVMFLEDGTRAHFMKFLEREFPLWLPRYEKLYARKYAPEEYRKQVQGMIRVLQERYGLTARVGQPHKEESPEAEQVAFRW